jgi:hypothetical protein
MTRERIAECVAINLASARLISAKDIREFCAYLRNCTDVPSAFTPEAV